ncbi:MAG: DNA polymerase II, partial [Aureispira sp.]|nr:DNA polymerase II [Aureispira sp.]
FLPKIIEDLWEERELAKKENDLVRSQAIKIIMYSFYGVLGSSGCRFYDDRLASSVTLRGHEIMQETRQWIEEQNYKVIYGDTDSIFVIADKTINKEQVQTEGRRLANIINKKWSHVIAERFELSSHLELEMETVYERFFMPTIRGQQKGSKKRYVGLQTDEGNSQVVFKGMEAVRSDWTLLAKKFQLGLYQYVFSDKDPSEFI